jgi:hypothetical protein
LAFQRYKYFGKLFAEPKDISMASLKDLCLFVRGTGLMNQCWMEYLGLHHKPKAAVHPELLLMGPLKKKQMPGCTAVIFFCEQHWLKCDELYSDHHNCRNVHSSFSDCYSAVTTR